MKGNNESVCDTQGIDLADILKSMDAGTPVETKVLIQHMKNYIAKDEKKYILLFDAINHMDMLEAKMIDAVMLRQVDRVKKIIAMPDCTVYVNEDLTDLYMILIFIKHHIARFECRFMEDDAFIDSLLGL